MVCFDEKYFKIIYSIVDEFKIIFRANEKQNQFPFHQLPAPLLSYSHKFYYSKVKKN